jgi:hypothetical protein
MATKSAVRKGDLVNTYDHPMYIAYMGETRRERKTRRTA